MIPFLAGRLARVMVLAVVVVSLIFILFRLVPGDPALLYAGLNTTPEALAQIRHNLGLDLPLWLQYLRYWADLLHGNPGLSTAFNENALVVVARHIPYTLELIAAGMAIAVTVGVATGTAAARLPGTSLDLALSAATVALLSIPNFWLGLMLVLFFAVQLHVLPALGASGPTSLILPAVVLAARIAAVIARITRAAVLEVLSADFVRTSQSKGLPARTIFWRHVFTNAMQTVLTVTSMEAGYLLGGSIVVEILFAWPGLGYILINSINMRDYALVQTLTVFYVLAFLVLNLLTDLLYGVVDPRIRVAG
ncbi:MAG: ABC transporter permease [Chloroflexota bacterium]|nr:ABC transporter permease [Chloroflexota bacterium]